MTGDLRVTGASLLETVALSELPADPSAVRDIASSAQIWRDMRHQALTRDERSHKEEELAQAREEGYRSGLLDGRAAAESEGLDVLARLPEMVEEARERVERAVADMSRDTSPLLVEAALEIAKWALAREVSQSPEVLLEIAERALTEAGGAAGASLHVSPELGALAARWASRFGVERPEVVEDSAVPPGVVSLKSRSGGFGEVSVESLIARATEALRLQVETSPPPQQGGHDDLRG